MRREEIVNYIIYCFTSLAILLILPFSVFKLYAFYAIVKWINQTMVCIIPTSQVRQIG